MSEPRFLTVQQVENLQLRLIERFGGIHGLRDRSLFEGAVIQPQNVYYYADGDLFDLAAAYAFHLAQAQAFLDGNKRAGIAAALTFLEGNSISVPTDTLKLYDAMIAIAEKRLDKVGLAVLFRQLCA